MIEQRRHAIFKLKIGKRSVREDVAHVAAIKKALGERGSVRVDVNQGWDEAQADLGMGLLADCGCDLVEQPVARDALPADCARVGAELRRRIDADPGRVGVLVVADGATALSARAPGGGLRPGGQPADW
mgnify:CR=1 FL=1